MSNKDFEVAGRIIGIVGLYKRTPGVPSLATLIAAELERSYALPEAGGMTWRKCQDDDHAERKGVHLLKAQAMRGCEISVTALWQHDFYECIVKVPPLTAEAIDGVPLPQVER